MPDKEQFLTSLKGIEKSENELEGNLKRLNKDIKFYTSNTNCPSCKQEVDEDFRKETLDEKESEKVNVEDRLNHIETLIQETSDRIENIDQKEKEIREQEKLIVEQKSMIKSLYSQIQYIEQEIDDLKNNRGNIEEEKDKLYEFCETQRKTLSEKDSLLNQKYNYDVVYDLLKDAGIKAKIIKYYLPIINKLINKYLSSLIVTGKQGVFLT